MEIIEPGHIYRLNWLDGDPLSLGKRERELKGDAGDDRSRVFVSNVMENDLVFVNREDNRHAGTQTQEVLRALIDRTKHCDDCLRWEKNDLIIYHLRMALVLHEARALERKTEKGIIEPEFIEVGHDGHFILKGLQERI